MTESFFDRLELELRAAAARPQRRRPRAGSAALALAVVAAIALALVPVAVLLGGGDDAVIREPAPADRAQVLPVGTVIPDKTGTPPRDGNQTVVATGTAPVFGPWQMESGWSRVLRDPKTGEEYQPAGLPCLYLYLPDPPEETGGYGGQCGEFPRTPGFSRSQEASSMRVGARVEAVLVYGRTPEAAKKVVLTADGGIRVEVEPHPGPPGWEGGFYMIDVKPGMENGRVNWLDANGNPGSRGIELLPPASGHVKRG